NDTDIDGNPLTVKVVSGPSHGALTLNPDGSFSYIPALNFNGTDSFTYVANDGTVDSPAATVTITVTPVNDTPVAADDSYSTSEDTQLKLAIPGLLGNDSDVDGVPLTAVLVSGPSNGLLALNVDGSFTYTPNLNFNGTDSFTYVANDGSQDSAPATVTITVTPVNDAPAAADNSYSVNAGAILNVTLPGILANDSDIDGDALTAVLLAGPTNGTLTLNSDGSLTYTPAIGFSGSDSFTYKANDGTLDSNAATVSVTVNPVLPPPTGDVHFYVVDTSSRRTFEYDNAGSMLTNPRLNTEDEDPMGVAVNSDGSLRWVVDSKGEVFVYNDRNALLGSWEIKGVDKVEGITVNGSDLLIVDSSNDRVYLFAGGADLRSGKAHPASSFALNRANRNATDLVTDGNHIWVVNDTAATDQVFRYSMTGQLEGSWTIDPANTKPTGITLAPGISGDIWIVDSRTDQAYGYTGAAELTSASATADIWFALNSADRNSQGIAAAIPAAPIAATSFPVVVTPTSKATADSIFNDASELPPTPAVRTHIEDDDSPEKTESDETEDSDSKESRSSASRRVSSKHSHIDHIDALLLDDAFAADDLFQLLGR
ncbi:MAG: tandem-95 repeat protein, partial [Rhodopirellula sp.]|nr:tandem-95 repeat protein [Rhodopirellula sp.]